LVLAVAIFQVPTVIRLARSNCPKRIKIANPELATMSPRTQSELSWWVALSISAGFCEEFVFRGYIIWAFQPVFGLWGSAAFSLVVFAIAHSYQGLKGVLAVGAAGLILTLVVLISGSLWPAIVLHALVDIGQGLTAWLALRHVEDPGSMVEA